MQGTTMKNKKIMILISLLLTQTALHAMSVMSCFGRQNLSHDSKSFVLLDENETDQNYDELAQDTICRMRRTENIILFEAEDGEKRMLNDCFVTWHAIEKDINKVSFEKDKDVASFNIMNEDDNGVVFCFSPNARFFLTHVCEQDDHLSIYDIKQKNETKISLKKFGFSKEELILGGVSNDGSKILLSKRKSDWFRFFVFDIHGSHVDIISNENFKVDRIVPTMDFNAQANAFFILDGLKAHVCRIKSEDSPSVQKKNKSFVISKTKTKDFDDKESGFIKKFIRKFCCCTV
jgi:hypothetical protein